MGLLPGVCVLLLSRGLGFSALFWHTDMPPVTAKSWPRCRLHMRIPFQEPRESGVRFVLRRRRRCPVGLLPACALHRRDEPALALIFT